MATKPFRWQPKRFATVSEFAAYLATLPRPSWARGVTIHHTWDPTLDEWRGLTTLAGIGNYYRGLGWDSGPQLFISNEGIYQGTPIDQIGIHALECNPTMIGIEAVGNYDLSGWPPAVAALIYGALVEIWKWLGLTEVTAANLKGHRDCGSSKTCPGLKISMTEIRRELTARLDPLPLADCVVIGAVQQPGIDRWLSFCERNHAPLSLPERREIYRHAERRNVDAAFFGGLWKREGMERPTYLGSSQLQLLTRGPLNIKAAAGEWRPTVEIPKYPGIRWLAYEDFYSGCWAAIEHIKTVYGWAGGRPEAQRHTLRRIIDVFMREPSTTQAQVDRYGDALWEDMQYIRTH